MEFDGGAAVLAGLFAGIAMLATRLGVRAAGVGIRMDVVRMWSTMFGVRGVRGRYFGLGVHVLVSAVVGLVYAWGLRHLFGADDALWLWGLLGGAIHYAIAGVFLLVAPEINPDMPDRIPAPGMFASRLGAADVAAFTAGHLAFGLTFGIVYALLHRSGGASVAF